MPFELWQGLLIPFAGTTLGAACVFFMRNNLSELVQRARPHAHPRTAPGA